MLRVLSLARVAVPDAFAHALHHAFAQWFSAQISAQTSAQISAQISAQVSAQISAQISADISARGVQTKDPSGEAVINLLEPDHRLTGQDFESGSEKPK